MNKKNGYLTTISITSITRERLGNLCKKGESYDKFLNKLLSFWETEKQ